MCTKKGGTCYMAHLLLLLFPSFVGKWWCMQNTPKMSSDPRCNSWEFDWLWENGYRCHLPLLIEFCESPKKGAHNGKKRGSLRTSRVPLHFSIGFASFLSGDASNNFPRYVVHNAIGDEDGHDGDYDQMQQGIPFKNNGHSVVGVQRLKNAGKNCLF